MPIWKSRSLDQMPTWTPGGHQDPLTRALELSGVAHALAQRSVRRGVFRFRSAEEAWRDREAWERSNRTPSPPDPGRGRDDCLPPSRDQR